MSIKKIAEAILGAKKIGISFHTSPDGDAIGSTLGLLNALRVLGKDSYIISREVIPDNLSFLPLGNEIDGTTIEPKENTDLVIILDCGNVERICADLENYSGTLINLDHHATNEQYGTINYVEHESAATCELVYLLVNELGIKFDKVNDESLLKIGSCIYTGILTDTGSFRHSNVTERTHVIASKLISIGVKNNVIHSNLFENRPYSKIKLIGTALESLELYCEGKVAFIAIPLKVLEELDLVNVDTSDIISMALSINTVEVAVLIKESEEESVKGSLRSKNDVNVSKIAEALGGGGHVKAAGFKLKNTTLDEAREKIMKEINKEL